MKKTKENIKLLGSGVNVNFVMLDKHGNIDNRTVAPNKEIVVRESSDVILENANSTSDVFYDTFSKSNSSFVRTNKKIFINSASVVALAACVLIGKPIVNSMSAEKVSMARSVDSMEAVDDNFLRAITDEPVFGSSLSFSLEKDIVWNETAFKYTIDLIIPEDAWSINEGQDSILVTVQEDKIDLAIGKVAMADEFTKGKSKDFIEQKTKELRQELSSKGISEGTVKEIIVSGIKESGLTDALIQVELKGDN